MAIRRWSGASERLELGDDAFVIGEEILGDSRTEQAVQTQEAPPVVEAGQPRHHLRRLAPPAALVAVGVAALVASSLLRDGSTPQTSSQRGRLAEVDADEHVSPNRRGTIHGGDGRSEPSARAEPRAHQQQPSASRANAGRANEPAPSPQSAPVAFEPQAVEPATPAVPAAPAPVAPAAQASAEPEPMSRQEIIAREFGP